MRAAASPRPLFSAFAVALGMSFVAGYLNTLRELPLQEFHAEWAAFIFFGLAAAFIAPALPRRFALNPALLLLPLVLAALIGLQALLGRYGDWQTPAFWLGYLVLGAVALTLGQGIRAAGLAAETVNRIAWAFLICALLNCLAQLIQAVHLSRDLAPFVVPLLTCQPYGNIGQSNHAATLAWLGLASTLYLRASGRLPTPAALAALSLLLVGAALSASRTNWLLLAVTAGSVVGLPAWTAVDRRGRLFAAATLVCGFVAASFATASTLQALGPHCVSGLDRLTIPNESGIVARLDWWRQAVTVWSSSPWIGVGAFGFARTAYAIVPLDSARGLDMYVHNALLQVLAEFGAVGAGLLGVLLLLLAQRLVRARRQLTAADSLMLVVIALIGTHSMLEYPLWYVQFLMPFCLAMGLLVRPEWAKRAPALPLRLPLLAAATGILAAAAILFIDYRSLDRLAWMEIFRQNMAMTPTPEVRARVGEALADVRLFRVKAEFIAALSEPIAADELPRRIAATERLLAANPQPAEVVRRIALAVLDDDPDTARLHLRRLFAFFPRFADGSVRTLRRLVDERPGDFAALGPLLDEELTRRSRPAGK